MFEILKWVGITCLGLYIFIAVVVWFIFWKWGMFRDDVDGIFAEGWESFKLAFSWPWWGILSAYYLRKSDLMRDPRE